MCRISDYDFFVGDYVLSISLFLLQHLILILILIIYFLLLFIYNYLILIISFLLVELHAFDHKGSKVKSTIYMLFLLKPYTVYAIVYYRMPCIPMSMLPIPKTPTHVCTHMYITHTDTDRKTICIIHGVYTLFTGSCMCRNGKGSCKRGCCDHSIQGSWLDVYAGRVPHGILGELTGRKGFHLDSVFRMLNCMVWKHGMEKNWGYQVFVLWILFASFFKRILFSLSWKGRFETICLNQCLNIYRFPYFLLFALIIINAYVTFL